MTTHELARFDQSIKQATLGNGLRVAHIPRHSDQRIYMTAVFGTGVRYEDPEFAGLSHFLEHSLFRGSRRYPTSAALSEAFEWLGGEWNAATGTEHTEFWYSGIARNRKLATELFADFLGFPTLGNIETERQIILRELQGELNEYGVSTDPTFHIAALMYPGTPFAMPILGTPDSLAKIDRAALELHRSRFYRPDNMVVVVVSPGDSDAIFRDVETAFADMPAGSGPVPKAAPLPKWKGPKAIHHENPDNEYLLQIAFGCASMWSPEAQAIDLVSRIVADGFSSRLARRLREELGLVYDISSDVTLYQDSGTLNIATAVSEADVDALGHELFNALGELAANGPGDQELARCRERSLVDLELIPSEPASAAFRTAWHLLHGKSFSLTASRERVLALTRADVREQCGKLFRRDNLAVVALGPSAASGDNSPFVSIADRLIEPSKVL